MVYETVELDINLILFGQFIFILKVVLNLNKRGKYRIDHYL